MKKRILSILLTVCVLFTLLPTVALATGTTPAMPVEVGTSDALKEALVTGGSIMLTADIKTPETAVYYDVTQNTVLDLNGHELSGLTYGGRTTETGSPAPTSFIVVENGATLTVTDGSAQKSGAISATYRANSSLFVIDINNDSKLILNEGTVTNGNDVNYGSTCVYVRGTGSFEMNGGKVTAVTNPDRNMRNYAIWVNATNQSVTINSGTIATDSTNGISKAAPLKISGGTYENNTFPGIAYLASGKHAVWAGTTCTVSGSAPDACTAAVTRNGATEYFETVDTAVKKLASGDTLTIGTVNAAVTHTVAAKTTCNISVLDSGSIADTSKITVAGTLSVTGTVPDGVIVPAAGYTLRTQENVSTTTYEAYVADADAVVHLIKADGTTINYLTPAAASFDSEDGDIIKLIKPVDLGAGYVSLSKAITFDLNGQTLTSASTSKYGTVALYTKNIRITDSSIAGKGKIQHTAGSYGIYINGSGMTYTIEKVGVTAVNDAAIYVNAGTANILSGIYTGVYGVNVKSAAAASASISGGSFSGTTSSVNKGTSGTLSITGGYFTADPAAYLAEGKIAGTSDKAGYAFMVKDAVTNVDVAVGETQTRPIAEDAPGKAELDKVVVAPDASDTGLKAAGGNEAIKVTESEKTAAASELSNAGVDTSGATVTVVVQPKLEVTPKSYDSENKQLTLDIKAVCDTIATTDPSDIKTDGEAGVKNAVVTKANQPMTVPTGTPVVIKVKIPGEMAEVDNSNATGYKFLTIKHIKESGAVYYYEAAVTKESENYYTTFTVTNGFSAFTLMAADTRTVAVTYDSDIAADNYSITDVGTTLPIPTKSGYTFTGWAFAGRDGIHTTLPDFWSGTTDEIAGQTATAQFSYNVSSYTLTFDVNGGSAIASVIKASGSTIDLSNYKPTRTGYVFDGWHADKELSTKVDSVNLTKNTTVYAKWTLRGDFTDIPENSYYKDAVDWALDNGITTGISTTIFDPNGVCTRAQAVTFLWRAMGSPEPTVKENPFTDVAASDYYYKAVMWAVEKGITSGASATTFAPHEICNRAQFVIFLWRAAGKPVQTAANPFTDLQSGAYYESAVLWAAAQKITEGTSATTFSPNDNCTRAQIVTLLYRRFK